MSAVPIAFSNNQIDKLGERLKAGNPSDEDLTMLSSFRNSFADAANVVADKVRELSSLPVAVRSLKTTLSIVAKLQRDGVKQLSAMQDIGGCRVTVSDSKEQDELTENLMAVFQEAKLYDRVTKPSHDYRAKHLVVKLQGKRIEIQVRTFLQNEWALVSEMMADTFGQNLKYGSGNIVVSNMLKKFSDSNHEFETKNHGFIKNGCFKNGIAIQLDLVKIEIEEFKKVRNDLLHRIQP